MSPAARQTERRVVLGIETSTSLGSVALCGEGATVGELLLRTPGSHSERLFPAIENLMLQTGLVPRDLAAVAVSTGPGSFTGLRVGAAAAKGLAFSLDIPLYGVPTLEVLAASATPGPAPLCAVLDARRGEVFAAFFSFEGDRPVKLGAEEVIPPRRLAAKLPPGTVIIGEIPPPLRALLAGRAGRGCYLAPQWQSWPRASAVAREGSSMLERGRPSEIETLVPLYLRPSDAEAGAAKRARRQRGSQN